VYPQDDTLEPLPSGGYRLRAPWAFGRDILPTSADGLPRDDTLRSAVGPITSGVRPSANAFHSDHRQSLSKLFNNIAELPRVID
jgi:hypothetical protein